MYSKIRFLASLRVLNFSRYIKSFFYTLWNDSMHALSQQFPFRLMLPFIRQVFRRVTSNPTLSWSEPQTWAIFGLPQRRLDFRKTRRTCVSNAFRRLLRSLSFPAAATFMLRATVLFSKLPQSSHLSYNGKQREVGRGWQITLPELTTTHAKPDVGAILCMGPDNTRFDIVARSSLLISFLIMGFAPYFPFHKK